MYNELINKETKLSLIGLGYVGLPIALAFAKKVSVIGFDINKDRVELMRKLHDLEEPYREVMYLRALGGLSFAEIGEIQGKSENWARVTFYRAKEKLRKEEL